MNTSINPNSVSNPLETLVVQQLAHLIEDEKILATQYPALNSQPENSEQRAAFTSGLAELRRRAERLQRFMDALDSFGSGSRTPALVS